MASYGISDWRKLGAVLRDARRSQQLSQEELAEQAGVSRAWLAKLESGGHRRAEIEQVFKLLTALSLELVVRDKQLSAEESTFLNALEDVLRTDPIVSTSSVIRKWARASAASPSAGVANQSTDDRPERDAATDASERSELEQVNASAVPAEVTSAGARSSDADAHASGASENDAAARTRAALSRQARSAWESAQARSSLRRATESHAKSAAELARANQEVTRVASRAQSSRRAEIAAERRAALARDNEAKRARELARSQTSAHTITGSSAAK